jgi:hypothetical protein
LYGDLVILLPLLLGRVVALGGWTFSPVVFLLVAVGLGVEFLAWASGFGYAHQCSRLAGHARRAWLWRRRGALTDPPNHRQNLAVIGRGAVPSDN